MTSFCFVRWDGKVMPFLDGQRVHSFDGVEMSLHFKDLVDYKNGWMMLCGTESPAIDVAIFSKEKDNESKI